MVMYGVIDDQ